MSEICYVAYSEVFAVKARGIFQNNAIDADVLVYEYGIWEFLMQHGYRVIMARGGTASRLRNNMKLPVVDIQISFEDIIMALLSAGARGKKIGVVGYGNFLGGLDKLNPILNVEITQVVATSPEDTRQKIIELKESGVEVVVGGLLQTQLAKEFGMGYVLLDLNEQSLLSAYQEAHSIQESMLYRTRKSEELNAILSNTREGYVSVDKNGIITLINPVAVKLLSFRKDEVLGQPLSAVFPELLALLTVIKTGKERLQETVHVGHRDILYNMIPLRLDNGMVMGAIMAFNDVKTITQGEHTIRSNLFSKGLYASYSFDNIVCKSETMLQLINTAKRFAQTESTVLIIGETGVGKELFAQSIHNASNRSKGPFVGVNCGSIAESILESELFGYEEGAFTGAKKGGKIGLFELAHHGTIFLDEISQIPMQLQGRLLRVLQERKVMRVGGNQIIPIDVRIISATNETLSQLVDENKFRVDLFYRLNVLTLIIPPLRERTDDIPMLVSQFLDKQNTKPDFTLDAIKALKRYPWHGNVRQLENFIEKISVISTSNVIDEEMVYETLLKYEPDAVSHAQQKKEYHNTISKQELYSALEKCGGNRQKTAEMLGIHRSTLWRILQKI